MKTFLKTIKFLRSLLDKPSQHIVPETKSLTINTTQTLDMDVYEPTSNYQGTIIFFHGMNKYGKNDERVEKFCCCLANIGFRVVVPNYPKIMQHVFDVSLVDDFEDTLLALTHDKQICPQSQISIFTVSLSGTVAIRACGRPSLKNKILAFFTIGSAFYVRDVFRTGFERSEPDSYMKMICAKNVLRSDANIDHEVIEAMDVLINDVFVEDEPDKLPEILPKLKPENRELIERISGKAGNTSFLYQRYENFLTKLENDLFASGDDSSLDFPIIFMHSAYDHVFAPEETLKLSASLTEKGVLHDVFITTLMEHVDHNFSLKKINEVWTMLRLFMKFFNASQQK